MVDQPSNPKRTSQRTSSTFVISLTPFDATGAVDEEGLREHLRRLRSSGIGVYVGGSGSGEGYTLTRDERRRVLEIAAEELRGHIPVRGMGVEPRSAREMIAYGHDVAEAGLDAMQLYSLDQGHGYRPRSEELEGYLVEVLEAVEIPTVISSHQAVGYAIPADLVSRLLDRYPHLIGVNFTNSDVTALVRMVDAVAGRADVHVGGPMQALTALAVGAQGFLSSEGNLAPRLCVSVIEHHQRGDLVSRDTAFGKLLRLFAATQRAGGVSATKGALGRLGHAGGWPRKPRLPVSDARAADLIACMESLALIESEEIGSGHRGDAISDSADDRNPRTQT